MRHLWCLYPPFLYRGLAHVCWDQTLLVRPAHLDRSLAAALVYDSLELRYTSITLTKTTAGFTPVGACGSVNCVMCFGDWDVFPLLQCLYIRFISIYLVFYNHSLLNSYWVASRATSTRHVGVLRFSGRFAVQCFT